MLAKRKTIADTAPPNGFIALEWRRRVFSTATTVERNYGHRASTHERENGALERARKPRRALRSHEARKDEQDMNRIRRESTQRPRWLERLICQATAGITLTWGVFALFGSLRVLDQLAPPRGATPLEAAMARASD